MPDASEEERSLMDQRFDVSTRIEKVLLRRNLLGDWTPALRVEYALLCERERALIERLATRAPLAWIER
jgi:hypothetical protein